jgi:hypothetical protein
VDTAVNNLRMILQFGWPYVRRYSGRFLVGILFGLSNAGFVWATKTLIGRMAPASEIQSADGRGRNDGFACRLRPRGFPC